MFRLSGLQRADGSERETDPRAQHPPKTSTGLSPDEILERDARVNAATSPASDEYFSDEETEAEYEDSDAEEYYDFGAYLAEDDVKGASSEIVDLDGNAEAAAPQADADLDAEAGVQDGSVNQVIDGILRTRSSEQIYVFRGWGVRHDGSGDNNTQVWLPFVQKHL